MMALCDIPNVQTWTGLNQERPYFANFSTVSYCFGKVTSSSWTQISNEESELSQSHTNPYKLEMPDGKPRPHQILCGQVIQEITWRSWRISMKATQTAWGLFLTTVAGPAKEQASHISARKNYKNQSLKRYLSIAPTLGSCRCGKRVPFLKGPHG